MSLALAHAGGTEPRPNDGAPHGTQRDEVRQAGEVTQRPAGVGASRT
jgi:hypothetical protein